MQAGVCICCHNKGPQTGALKQQSLIAPEARCLKCRCWQGRALSGGPGENPPFPLLASGVCLRSLGLPGVRMHHSSHMGVFSCVLACSTCSTDWTTYKQQLVPLGGERGSRESQALPPCEDPVRWLYEPGNGFSPECDPAAALVVNFLPPAL